EIKLARRVASLNAKRIDFHGTAKLCIRRAGLPLRDVYATQMNMRRGEARTHFNNLLQIFLGVSVAFFLKHGQAEVRKRDSVVWFVDKRETPLALRFLSTVRAPFPHTQIRPHVGG